MTAPEEHHATSDALKRLRCYQDILTSFSRIALESTDLDSLLHLACVQAARGMDISHTKVLRYRPETSDLLMVAGIGWKEGLVGNETFGTFLASPPGRALQTRQPVTIQDLPANTDYKISPTLQEHNIHALLNTPIITDNKVWGVLEIDSEQKRGFSHDDVNFMLSLANILGGAIHRHLLMKAAEDEVQKAQHNLTHQRTLMREIQHRVKNNFMVIISTLMLEKQKQQDEQTKTALDNVMGRVIAISTAHDQLTMQVTNSNVNLSSYLGALASNLARQYEWVQIEKELAPMMQPIDRATPLGLILNELATNAIKHAFPEHHGTIRVGLRADGNGREAWLTVEDDGIGMGPSRPGSWGMKLVEALVRQIGGYLAHESSDSGTVFRIRFPLT
ncbi:sensor histidine kinase [Telmatospirillum sp. J64-1]|uniref:sensor histidine kinase n=1 Tax=Telmatospirillum sp. J64-1 TaxID=2502183 RepID=UPI00115E2AE8|nr:histidine kinase dimerization/phosphoacceptor domain -containing protein [Telmatospirillum sp. J64-1]